MRLFVTVACSTWFFLIHDLNMASAELLLRNITMYSGSTARYVGMDINGLWFLGGFEQIQVHAYLIPLPSGQNFHLVQSIVVSNLYLLIQIA